MSPTRAGGPHACAEEKGEHEVPPDALIDRFHHRAEEERLAEGRDCSERQPQREERLALASSAWHIIRMHRRTDFAEAEKLWTEVRQRPVQEDIRPAAYCKLRGQFPRLEPRVVLEVMQWLEEVEH